MKFILNIIILVFTIGGFSQNIKKIETVLPFTDEFSLVEVKEVGNQFVFNGDILVKKIKKPPYYEQLIKEKETVLKQSVATANINNLWKDAVIPYVISPLMPLQKKNEILEAIKTINTETVVNIIPKTYQKDYIFLRYNEKGGCNSYIGRIGGKQIINISDWCEKGNIIHEFFHALGVYHEHNRIDRDRYIRINWDKISGQWKTQYQKVTNRNITSFGAYDYESIMHYPRINGSFDCYDVAKCKKVGNRTKLSFGDIQGIKNLYKDLIKNKTVNNRPYGTKQVPVFIKTILAYDQISESIVIKIDGKALNFSVSFRNKEDQVSFELEEGKFYEYEVYVDCTEFQKINSKYIGRKRIGKGKGRFRAEKNKELKLYSNRELELGVYKVVLR